MAKSAIFCEKVSFWVSKRGSYLALKSKERGKERFLYLFAGLVLFVISQNKKF